MRSDFSLHILTEFTKIGNRTQCCFCDQRKENFKDYDRGKKRASIHKLSFLKYSAPIFYLKVKYIFKFSYIKCQRRNFLSSILLLLPREPKNEKLFLHFILFQFEISTTVSVLVSAVCLIGMQVTPSLKVPFTSLAIFFFLQNCIHIVESHVQWAFAILLHFLVAFTLCVCICTNIWTYFHFICFQHSNDEDFFSKFTFICNS